MKKLLVVPMVAGLMLVAGAAPALAMPAPGGGADFGQHVSTMAPEHVLEPRSLFGECVSAMARGDCSQTHSAGL